MPREGVERLFYFRPGGENMDFETLFKEISPKLKRIARNHNGHGFFIGEEDLYQEMCIHLWNNFKGGLPDGLNEAYVVKSCEFHILNYLRKNNTKAIIVSLEKPINDDGYTLGDILPDGGESLDKCIDRNLTMDKISNNGLTKKEKVVFLLLLAGYTVREIGKEMGISHVMVVKRKKKIIEKCQKIMVTKKGNFLL